jgi:hypothetical protein
MADELRQFRETRTNVEDFNRDLSIPEVTQALGERLKKEAKFCVPHFDEQHNHWLLRLGRIREAAGSLSGHLQPRLDSALFVVLVFLGLSILAFHLYAHLFDFNHAFDHIKHQPLYLVAFLILLLAAVAVVVRAWWSGWTSGGWMPGRWLRPSACGGPGRSSVWVGQSRIATPGRPAAR